MNYLKNYLDKLDLVSRWVVFPKLFDAFEFPTEGQAFQRLRTLVSVRNEIAHSKSSTIDLSKFTPEQAHERIFGLHKQADTGIECLDLLAKVAVQFDPDAGEFLGLAG